jgi:hypothetical protein
MPHTRRRTCAVLQPGYLPWLGFFEQVWRADAFVLLDDVQFDKHGWRNRNRIKTPTGPQWLTVPVRTHNCRQPRIVDVVIEPTQHRWPARHLHTLHTNYASAPHFDWLFDDLCNALEQPWQRLVDLDVALTNLLCDKLGLPAPQHRASTLGIAGERSQRLVRICQQLDCTHYYSGAAARDYLDLDLFEQAGIAVTFQDYQHPTYPQRYGDFVSHLSVVDLLFNCGPASLDVLTADQPLPVSVEA